MLKKQKKKQIFYEVNPLFFYDYDGDGFGDLIGLSKKIDYFKFIDISCIIIPDIFNNNNNLLFNNALNSKYIYGKHSDLIELIENLKINNIEFAVEINLRDIKKSLLFSENNSNNNFEFKDSKKEFFLDKNQNGDWTENWNSIKTTKAFDKVIGFWNNLNVNNFVFTNFEYLYNKNIPLDNLCLEQIKNLYKTVNKLNSNITIILKSALLTQKNIDDCLNATNTAADFFINNSYSLVGLDPKKNNDKFEVFKPYKLFSKIENSFVSNEGNSNKNIMSLGSSLSGRINSRWGNEDSLFSLASKALLTISLTSSHSSLIYYGDELGMLKINIKNKEDFNDIYSLERGRLLQSQGQSQNDFIKAQQYLSPINTQSLFQWDSSKNGGFSKGNVSIRQLSTTYDKINVSKQYNDKDSSLYYLKNIIEFIKNPIYSIFFNNSITTVKTISKDIIKYTHKHANEKLFIFINASNKWKKININSKLEVIFSNYTEKKYVNKIKMLAPFESIILFPKSNNN